MEARLAGKTDAHHIISNDPPLDLAQNSILLLPLQLRIRPDQPLSCGKVPS